jgi:hypothetical protein
MIQRLAVSKHGYTYISNGGTPKSRWVLRLSHGIMTWMIWGSYILGNFQIPSNTVPLDKNTIEYSEESQEGGCWIAKFW